MNSIDQWVLSLFVIIIIVILDQSSWSELSLETYLF